MTATKKTHVSVIAINDAIGKLTGRNKLRVLEFQNYWNNGTGYFDGLVNTSAEVVGVEEGELTVSMDTAGRFVFIGVLEGNICCAFQRYQVEPGKQNTTIILQLQNEDDNVAGKALGDTHGPMYFEQLLQFIRLFKNGNPIADSINSRAGITVSETEIAKASSAAVALTTSAEPTLSEANQENLAMSNNNQNTAAAATDAVANAAASATQTVKEAAVDATGAAAGAVADAADAVSATAQQVEAKTMGEKAKMSVERARDVIANATGNIKRRDVAFFGGGVAAGVLGVLAFRALTSRE